MKATPVLFAAALAATGCLRAPLGPKTIPPARLNYNEAISRSWDEQLLLNLVRLRYRDNPLFVDVTSVSASYELNRNASVGFRSTGRDLDLTDVSGGLGMAYNEKPIVTYNFFAAKSSRSGCSHRLPRSPSRRSGKPGGASSACCSAASNRSTA